MADSTTAPQFLSKSPDNPGTASVAAHRLRLLSDIGMALSAERDIEKLLDLILTKAREITGCDAGSIYVVEREDENGDGQINLHFRAAQNDSLRLNTRGVTFPVSTSSLAGYVAFSGEMLCFADAYRLDPAAPYRFNPDFDIKHAYRTKSVLVLPLRNHLGQVTGVLQLINRKCDPQRSLAGPGGAVTQAVVERDVLPFDSENIELAASLASQAAVALENNQLLRQIERLFEAFVAASSRAIEDRDPTTSGHSERVNAMTLALAQAANEEETGPFADVFFSEASIKELRYATLLHDFGKIGVREKVLTKSHKLDLLYFTGVKDRLIILARERERECAQRKLEIVQAELTAADKMSPEKLEAALHDCDAQLQKQLYEIEEDIRLLTQINDPAISYVPDVEYARQLTVLNKLASLQYTGENSVPRPVISREEYDTLRVRRGSLTPGEYKEVQEHARLSFEFLNKIPWTPDLAQIPDLAHNHHEKLNGSGYPRGVRGDQIQLRTRMMTVADIFDALTASDRPYKKSMPADRALQILELEARNGRLDLDCVQLFIAHKIYRVGEAMQKK